MLKIGIAVFVLTLLCMTFLAGMLGYVWLSCKDCALGVIVAADKDVVDEVMMVMDEIRVAQHKLNRELMFLIVEEVRRGNDQR